MPSMGRSKALRLALCMLLTFSHTISSMARLLTQESATVGSRELSGLIGARRQLAQTSLGTQDVVTAYHYTVCKNSEVYKATTTAQVQTIMAAVKDSGKTVRAISHARPHSAAAFPCASAAASSPAVTILLEMDQVLGYDPTTGFITVGASMDMYRLQIETLELQYNRTIPTMTLPYHADLTVGGVFSVGAHGAQYRFPGLLIDMVQCVKYVNAKAEVKTACRDDLATQTMFRGLAGGLGLLGVVTELTIKTLPNSKTRLKVLTFPDDSNIEQVIAGVRADPDVDSLFVFWRPDVRAMGAYVTYTMPYDTPVNPTGAPFPPNSDGQTAPTGPFCALTSGVSLSNYAMLATSLKLLSGPQGLNKTFPPELLAGQPPELIALLQASAPDGNINNLLAGFVPQLVTAVWAANINSAGGVDILEPAYQPAARDIVGRTNHLSISSRCSDNPQQSSLPNYVCFYSLSPFPAESGIPDLSFTDTEIAVPDTPAVLKNVIADIREVVAKDLAASTVTAGFPGATPQLAIGAGVLFRWSAKSETILGPNGREGVIWVGMENFQAWNNADPTWGPSNPYPTRNHWATDLMEQRLLCKYNGRPHPGKNVDRAFLNTACPLNKLLKPELELMAALQAESDPQRILEPPLFKRMRSIKGGVADHDTIYYPGCDLDRRCSCTEDVHCGPDHRCVRSLAFPNYKVCKPVPGF